MDSVLSILDYVESVEQSKKDLADNLTAAGIESSTSEPLSVLVGKVAGSGSSFLIPAWRSLGGNSIVFNNPTYSSEGLVSSVGNLALGFSAVASGEETAALGRDSSASGSGSIAYGSYSHSEGDNGVSWRSSPVTVVSVDTENSQIIVTPYHWFTTMYALVSLDRKKTYRVSEFGKYSDDQMYIKLSSGVSEILTDETLYPILLGAFGIASHREGRNTGAYGDSTHAEGDGTRARGWADHSEGMSTNAEGGYGSHSEGYSTYAIGRSSHAENYNAVAIGYYSHAEGRSSIAGRYVFKVLSLNLTSQSITLDSVEGLAVNDIYTYLDGTTSKNYFNYGKILSINTETRTIVVDKIPGGISISESSSSYFWIINKPSAGTLTSGSASHAEGRSYAFGTCSHSENYGCVAEGMYTHAEGEESEAYGRGSHSQGYFTVASGDYSHAEGYRAIASGPQSHAEGYSTEAPNSSSHAEGSRTRALGFASHVEGDSTQALGDASHAEGAVTKALGLYSHAEGRMTTASGYHSHAEGFDSQAIGLASHSEGHGTVAASSSQHVQGQYNVKDTKGVYADIVGNGTSDSNRSNAATVDWHGNGWFAGEVRVGGTSQFDEDSKTLATEEHVKNEILSNTIGLFEIEGPASIFLAPGETWESNAYGIITVCGTDTDNTDTYTFSITTDQETKKVDAVVGLTTIYNFGAHSIISGAGAFAYPVSPSSSSQVLVSTNSQCTIKITSTSTNTQGVVIGVIAGSVRGMKEYNDIIPVDTTDTASVTDVPVDKE